MKAKGLPVDDSCCFSALSWLSPPPVYGSCLKKHDETELFEGNLNQHFKNRKLSGLLYMLVVTKGNFAEHDHPLFFHIHRPMSNKNKSTLLRQWVDDYTNDLLNWTYHKTSNLAVAEDLTQDTFLVAYQQMGRFREESSPRTWLFAILKNKIIDYYRGQFKKSDSIDFQYLKEEGFTPFDSDEKWISHHAPVYWESSDEHVLDNMEFRKMLGCFMGLLPYCWRKSKSSVCHAKRSFSLGRIRQCAVPAKITKNNLAI